MDALFISLLEEDFHSLPKAEVRQPTEIAHFSFDPDGDLYFDRRSLKYYYPSPTPISIVSGMERWIKKGLGPQRLHGLYETIQNALKHRDSAPDPNLTADADFCTWRGIVRDIMCLPFNRDSNLDIMVTKRNGIIYMYTDKQDAQGENQRHAMHMYGGYKFETLFTLEKAWDESTREEIESRDKVVVNNKEQYCSVVKTKIGQSTIVMGGEVDCIWDYLPDPPEKASMHYAELKTFRQIVTDKDREIFSKRLLKTWAQSFLLGVPWVVFGMKSQDLQVQSIVRLATQQMPEYNSRESTQRWNGQLCLNFLGNTLDQIRTKVAEDTVWCLQYEAGGEYVSLMHLPNDTRKFPEELYRVGP